MKQLFSKIHILVLFALFFSCSDDEGDSGRVNNLPEQFNGLFGAFPEGVGAATYVAADIAILFNKTGTRYAWYQNNQIQGIFDNDDANGPLGGGAPDAVDAALNYATGMLIFYINGGSEFIVYDYNPSQFSLANTSMPTSAFGLYRISSPGVILRLETQSSVLNNPAFNNMVSAACRDDAISGPFRFIFDNTGTEYIPFSFDNLSFGVTRGIDEWNPAGEQPFSSIGAAFRFTDRNSDEHIAFINSEGDQICFWDRNTGQRRFSEAYNLN